MPGYNINLEENKIGEPFLCTLCRKLLRRPIQTMCGHRCCNSCVKEWKGAADSFNCPEDGELVEVIFPDRFVEREVINLEVKCSNLKAGCKWIGLVHNFEEHVESCPFGSVSCTNDGCQIFLSMHNYDKHINEECQYRKIKCPLCMKSVAVIEFKLSSHQCEAKVDGAVPQHSSHQRDVEVDNVDSQITKEGDTLNNNSSIIQQLKEKRRQILQFPLSKGKTDVQKMVKDLKRLIQQMQENLNFQSRASDGIDLIIRRLETVEKQIVDLIESDENGKGKYVTLINYVNDISKDMTELGKKVESNEYFESFKSRYMTFVGVVNEMANRVDDIENQLKSLNYRVTEELTKKVNDQQRAIEGLKEVNAGVNDKERAIDALEVKINSLNHQLALNIVVQNDKLDTVEQTSYSGTLTWCIDDFKKRRHDAIIGKTIALYSPVFYTDHHGYKLRVRIYLNGDGLGKGTHISLFFVVCKSRFDAVLPWPFRQKVKMMILDQDNVEHVVDSFRPDPSSSSFQKPKNEMNVASGCPLFMPLAELNRSSYARDDTMFVKVSVEPVDK